MIRTSFKNNKRVLIIYFVLLLFGLITGAIYYKKTGINIYNSVVEMANNHNLININYYHILFFVLTIVGSFIYLGPIISFFNMFLEGFSIGIIVFSLVSIKMIKGFVFSLIFIVLSKTIYIILLLILGVFSIKYVLNKNNSSFNSLSYLKSFLLLIILCIINETIFLYFSNNVCIYFLFLIK